MFVFHHVVFFYHPGKKINNKHVNQTVSRGRRADEGCRVEGRKDENR